MVRLEKEISWQFIPPLKFFSGGILAVFFDKPEQEIVNAINDTVEIKEIIRPFYNFKAH